MKTVLGPLAEACLLPADVQDDPRLFPVSPASPDEDKRVSLLAKNLPSFDFVRATYLEGPTGQLPNQPWLTQRKRPGPVTPRRAVGGI